MADGRCPHCGELGHPRHHRYYYDHEFIGADEGAGEENEDWIYICEGTGYSS